MYRLPASGEDTCTHQHRLRTELFLSSEGGTSLFPEQAGVRKWALGKRETSKPSHQEPGHQGHRAGSLVLLCRV